MSFILLWGTTTCLQENNSHFLENTVGQFAKWNQIGCSLKELGREN